MLRLSLLLVIVSGVVGSEGLVRGPYLQMVTPDAITVCWQTTAAGVGGVKADKREWQEAAATTEHRVRLDGLKPATEYTYQISDSKESFTFRTAPAVGNADGFRTWIIGDSGTANENARNVYRAYQATTAQQYTDLWLMLGDNAYKNGKDDEYQRAVFDMYPEMLASTALFSCLGNHDQKSAKSATQSGPYFDIFEFPRNAECGGVASGTEAYYSFDYANAHFVSLDSSETDRSKGGAMYKWLEQDLAQNSATWLIAFWHHPPYTKGSHDSDKEGALVEMRENFLPLLESHGLDLCFTGHSHSYERSYLIDGHYGGSESFDKSKHCKDAGDGQPKGSGAYSKAGGPNNGSVYIVAGSSGKTSGKGSLDHPAMYRSLKVLGSVVMDIKGKTCALRFINDQGEMVDDLVIEKK